jgi:uncharacterized BrkB/YihY/UPF0761 family membrane protein
VVKKYGDDRGGLLAALITYYGFVALIPLLQAFGAVLVTRQLRHATAVYGFFATVIGLLGRLYLAAQITLYAAETNVVLHRRLWPRSLVQPPLTGDDQAYESRTRAPRTTVSTYRPRSRTVTWWGSAHLTPSSAGCAYLYGFE